MAILCLCVLTLTGCWSTGRGEHNGQITAVEKTGLVWQTNALYVKSDVSSSQEEKYCVENEDLLKEIKQYSKDRTKVTLYYKNELFIFPSRCDWGDTGIVYDVKPVVEERMVVEG